MNQALDEEARRMKTDGRDPLLAGCCSSAVKSSATTNSSASATSNHYNLKTVRVYLLKEAFQQLWDYNSPAWAAKFLDEWCRQTMRSRIEPPAPSVANAS